MKFADVHCIKGNKFRSDGFSLVELLVSMTLLIMVTLIGTYGYRLYSQYWQKELGHYQQTFEVVKGINKLHSIVKQIKPYVLKGGDKNAFYYFDGGPQVLRSVLSHGISKSEFPANFELEVIELDDVKQLVYREAAMDSGPIISEAEVSTYTFSTVVMSGYQDIRFEYLGWSSYDDRTRSLQSDDLNSPARQWFGFYSGKDTLIPPEVIKISLIDNTGNLSVIELPIAQIVEEQLEYYLIDN